MMRLAGFQRLLSHISIEEPLTDQIYLLKKAEQDVYAITRHVSPGQFRSQKEGLGRQIEAVWSSVPCRLAPAFVSLWKFVLEGGEASGMKPILESIGAEAQNNRLKRLILRDIRVADKYKGVAKQLLHVGEEFQSLFDEVDLDAGQRTIQAERLKAETALRSVLDKLIAGQRFEDEQGVLAAFWAAVSDLSDPVERNRYFNRLLTQLVQVLKGCAVIRLVTLFLQLLGRLTQGELVTTVDKVVQVYADTVDVRAHSLTHMGSVLAPHDPFRRTGWVLDPSQRRVLQVIRAKEASVFLAVPPGWGKTMLSTEAIHCGTNVWFLVPTPETAKQLTGILVASLYDAELKGGVARNIRLALDGERVPTYLRFPSKPDNLLVATPHRLWELVQSGLFTKSLPDRIILDEIHCIGSADPTTRAAYEYFLKFACWHDRPFIALSGTVGRENFAATCDWMRSLMIRPLFALQEERRFFEPERLTFQVDGDAVRTVPIQVLHHLRPETVRSPTFRAPGLPAADVERLLIAVPSFPKPVFRTPPSQDEVAALEHDIFRHVATSADAMLLKGDAILSDNLTPYQLYKVLQSMDESEKPLLVFIMDRKRHLEFSLLMSNLVTRYNDLVYANFKDDQPLVKAFLIAAKEFESEEEADEKERDLLRVKRDALFYKDYYPRLKAFYEDYVSQPIDARKCKEFCDDYGASLTEAEIRKRRREHVRVQLARLTPDALRPRSEEYVFHSESRISSASSGADLLRRVRKQLATELVHQRAEWIDLAKEYGAAFECYNNLYETRSWKRLNLHETRRMGQKWPTEIPDDLPGMEYSYEVPWDNWFLRGLEIGLLFYSDAFSPAFQHLCMILMNEYPLIVVSMSRMATGINCPFKASMLHGGFKGEPRERIDPTLGTQGLYRAGRRGFDKKARHFFSGVEIEPLLVPTYHPMGRNEPALLHPLVDKDAEDFRAFVLTERRPAVAIAVPVPVPVLVPVPVVVAPLPVLTKEPESWDDPEYLASLGIF